jgi:hypothetical protein
MFLYNLWKICSHCRIDSFGVALCVVSEDMSQFLPGRIAGSYSGPSTDVSIA